jgi:MFS family permease
MLESSQSVGTVSLLRHGNFVKLWLGQSVSLLGSAVTNIALPLVAVGLLQATVFQMGVLRALAFIPYIVLGLYVGVWVDRLRRRPVLIVANTIRALVLLVVPLSAVAGQLRIEVLYGVALAVGVASLFFEFAYQAYLPSLIPADALVDGNSKLAQSESVARIVGPAVGGFLIQVLSAPMAIIIDAASYVVSAVTLILITDREARAVAKTRPAIHREIAEGLAARSSGPIHRCGAERRTRAGP